MDFGKIINLAWRINKLERDAMRGVADDPQALLPVLLILVIGGALVGVGALNPFAIGGGLVLLPIFAFIGTGILHLLALAFGGKGSFIPYFQALGAGIGLLHWVGVVPFVGIFVQLWGIPVAVVTTEEIHGLDRTKAVIVVLIPAALTLILCCVLWFVVGTALLAAIAAASRNQ